MAVFGDSHVAFFAICSFSRIGYYAISSKHHTGIQQRFPSKFSAM